MTVPGTALLLLRESKGLTLTALAKASGLSKSLISKYENGHQNITLASIDKLAPVLGVAAEELIVQLLIDRYPRLRVAPMGNAPKEQV